MTIASSLQAPAMHGASDMPRRNRRPERGEGPHARPRGRLCGKRQILRFTQDDKSFAFRRGAFAGDMPSPLQAFTAGLYSFSSRPTWASILAALGRRRMTGTDSVPYFSINVWPDDEQRVILRRYGDEQGANAQHTEECREQPAAELAHRPRVDSQDGIPVPSVDSLTGLSHEPPKAGSSAQPIGRADFHPMPFASPFLPARERGRCPHLRGRRGHEQRDCCS